MFLEIERLKKKGEGKSIKRFDVYVNVNPAVNYRA